MRVEDLREQFPALSRATYLNTATAAPGSVPVLDALRRVQAEWASGEFSWQSWEEEGEATREQFANLVGGRAEEVSLMSSVAEAAATVAASLPPGRVVVGAGEFQSNLFPWLALRARGFEVVDVPERDGVVRTEDLLRRIDDRCVLVAVSEVQSAHGFRVHLGELETRCREAGARLFVNTTQSLGALRLGGEPDYVAAHGYKWLLGPRGAAWLWTHPDYLLELEPLMPSWKTVPEPHQTYYGGPIDLPAHARRVDTSLAWFSWPGARAALDLVSAVDAADVERRCLGLAEAFRDAATGRGFRLIPQDAPSQVVAVEVPDPTALRERLLERRVVGAVRGGRLRLGFHAYNDMSDVARALDALGRP